MECVFNSGSQPCAAGSREKAIGHANYVGSGLETSKLAIVILALVAGQPVDEKSHCRRLAPPRHVDGCNRGNLSFSTRWLRAKSKDWNLNHRYDNDPSR